MTAALRVAKAQISDAKWTVRVDLAALCRILHHLDMTHPISTRASAREMLDAVMASSLIKMDRRSVATRLSEGRRC